MSIAPPWSVIGILCVLVGVVAAMVAGRYFSARQRVAATAVSIIVPIVGGPLVVLYVLYCHGRATRQRR